jgi:hypothetical protein
MPYPRFPRSAGAMAAALALAACAGAPPQPELPPQLRPAPDQALALIVPARGVQIYECRQADPAAAPAWAFVAPEAELFDGRGHKIGQHGAGPRWRASDGSTIVGTLQQRADAPAPGAIPWLLLAARNDGPPGLFSRVSSVQRVNTVGGLAPATGCSRDTAGTAVRVAYTADYHFFSPR